MARKGGFEPPYPFGTPVSEVIVMRTARENRVPRNLNVVIILGDQLQEIHGVKVKNPDRTVTESKNCRAMVIVLFNRVNGMKRSERVVAPPDHALGHFERASLPNERGRVFRGLKF
jgi:hypothetical protein